MAQIVFTVNFNKLYPWLVTAVPSQTCCKNSNGELDFSGVKLSESMSGITVWETKKKYIYLFFNDVLENKIKKCFDCTYPRWQSEQWISFWCVMVVCFVCHGHFVEKELLNRQKKKKNMGPGELNICKRALLW